MLLGLQGLESVNVHFEERSNVKLSALADWGASTSPQRLISSMRNESLMMNLPPKMT